MTLRKLDPSEEYRLDITQKLAYATWLELAIRRIEEEKGDIAVVWSKLFTPALVKGVKTVEVDVHAIQAAKRGILRNQKAYLAEKDRALKELARYTEISRSLLEHYNADDYQEDLSKCAASLVLWVEDRRKLCIGLVSQNGVLKKEKEERDERLEAECAPLRTILEEIDQLGEHVRRISGILDGLDSRQATQVSLPGSNTLSGSYDTTDVDVTLVNGNGPVLSTKTMQTQISENLEDFRRSHSAVEQRSAILKADFAATLGNKPTPVQSVDSGISMKDMNMLVPQIVEDEFSLLVSRFTPLFVAYRDSLEVYDHIVERMAGPNKLVLMLLLASPDYVVEDGEMTPQVSLGLPFAAANKFRQKTDGGNLEDKSYYSP